MLLKGVDDGGFVFYTNYESRKGRQLAAQPQACLVFFWTQLERQVRIEGTRRESLRGGFRHVFREPACRAPACRRAPRHKASVVAGREVLEDCSAEAKGTVRRQPAAARRTGAATASIPSRIEFWQGRENRLHDRLLYLRDGGSWKIERLAP